MAYFLFKIVVIHYILFYNVGSTAKASREYFCWLLFVLNLGVSTWFSCITLLVDMFPWDASAAVATIWSVTSSTRWKGTFLGYWLSTAECSPGCMPPDKDSSLSPIQANHSHPTI